MITSFRNKYYFLSNFYICPTIYKNGKVYQTVEHAFQACKTNNKQEHEIIRLAETATKAKQLGKLVLLRNDWDIIKDTVMYSLVYQKFTKNNNLRTLLLETNNEYLIEGNWWKDKYWGACFENGQWIGENKLGLILMQIRDELK